MTESEVLGNEVVLEHPAAIQTEQKQGTQEVRGR